MGAWEGLHDFEFRGEITLGKVQGWTRPVRFHNSTELDGKLLQYLFETHSRPYRHDKLAVRVRYSRGADFSGRCYYADSRVFINLGRRNRYPYGLGTNVARSKSNKTRWWREIYTLTLADPYQLAVFIYMHEFFHFLVKAAGRCTRRKESMCDRFAARVLVDAFGCALTDKKGRAVARGAWDITDLERFVAKAPRDEDKARAPRPAYAAARVPLAGIGSNLPGVLAARPKSAAVTLENLKLAVRSTELTPATQRHRGEQALTRPEQSEDAVQVIRASRAEPCAARATQLLFQFGT